MTYRILLNSSAQAAAKLRKRNEESFSLCKTKGYYLIELIRRLVNETIWVLDNLCMCCNVEMMNNCSLYMRNHHYQHMVLLFVHQHIETDICLQESMELLIITAPIKLICRTNVSLISMLCSDFELQNQLFIFYKQNILQFLLYLLRSLTILW